MPTPSIASNRPIRLLLHGAGGRMGQAVRSLMAGCPALQLVATVSRSPIGAADAVPRFGTDAIASVPEFDVAIDFSLQPAFAPILALCVARRAALVSGTTGLTGADREALDDASRRIPLLWASNFSLGVAVLQTLAAQAAAVLADWDCEIVETHHRRKRDAPSGTALTLGRAVAAARQQPFTWDDRLAAPDARAAGSIGIASLRGGEVVGDHLVTLYGPGERLELGHRADDRRVFAAGALSAAQWLAFRDPGAYRMADVVGPAR
jgi:4-hydroxy-tetrahydrodipicolinate reductase